MIGQSNGAHADVFVGIARGAAGATAPAAPVDWPATKAAIVGRLDVAAEYEALGVAFTAPAANGKGWRECRAIDRPDEQPSAAVHLATGLYHDSGAGGATLNLFDFALKHGDWGRYIDVVRHYAAKAGVEIGAVATHGKGRIREAQYIYRDAAGEPRYSVFRYRDPNGKKSFTQHASDGRGGWKFGTGAMDGVEPLPYRLPELLAADPDDTVWIVEGEKDAERLAALELVATTNHGGSSNTDKTWPRFAEHFRGRICCVIPDNDQAGRIHARKVAAHLHGIAREVRVLELPGLPAKGDVSDWLDLGGSVDELGRLQYRAPAWDPGETDGGEIDPQGPPDRGPDATVADLRASISGAGWLWPSWIAGSALTLLAAEAGTGKTRFCMDLHRRLLHGLDWPDGAAIIYPGRPVVLWIAADGQYQELCDIASSFGIPDEAVILNTPAADPYGGTSLQTAEELADLEERIGRVKPAFVVIDTITNTGDFKAQDSSDAKRQYKPLQEIAIRQAVPILCVTHLNAGGKVLGRRAIEKVRVVVQMECPDPEGQPNRRKLWVSKSKAVRPAALGITMGDGGNEYDADPPEAPAAGDGTAGKAKASPRLKECKEWLAAALAGGRARVSVIRNEAEDAGFDAKLLYRARDSLRVEETEENNRKWWTLARAAVANGHADVPF